MTSPYIPGTTSPAGGRFLRVGKDKYSDVGGSGVVFLQFMLYSGYYNKHCSEHWQIHASTIFLASLLIDRGITPGA